MAGERLPEIPNTEEKKKKKKKKKKIKLFSFLNIKKHVSGSPPRSPPAGAVVCKLSPHRGTPRGYLAMLAVAPTHRRRGLASCLVRCVLGVLARDGAHEVVLEAERVNKAALGLYAALGFAREKRLAKYYLNGGDAFRLKLWIAEDERNEEAEILDV
jgi:ribosomal protein S18 acetylase RimI-like enzyme